MKSLRIFVSIIFLFVSAIIFTSCGKDSASNVSAVASGTNNPLPRASLNCDGEKCIE